MSLSEYRIQRQHLRIRFTDRLLSENEKLSGLKAGVSGPKDDGPPLCSGMPFIPMYESADVVK